jgi:excisionase family DNA binding protein
MIEGYLTTRETAEKLGVSEGRVRQLIAENRLPTTKIGNSNLIKESDLELVRERKRTGRPPKVKDFPKSKKE